MDKYELIQASSINCNIANKYFLHIWERETLGRLDNHKTYLPAYKDTDILKLLIQYLINAKNDKYEELKTTFLLITKILDKNEELFEKILRYDTHRTARSTYGMYVTDPSSEEYFTFDELLHIFNKNLIHLMLEVPEYADFIPENNKHILSNIFMKIRVGDV